MSPDELLRKLPTRPDQKLFFPGGSQSCESKGIGIIVLIRDTVYYIVYAIYYTTYYAILCYTILYYTILYYTILYYMMYTYVSTLRPVVICPYLCTSEAREVLLLLSIHLCICICMFVCVHICMYIHIYIYTYMDMCVYIYIYIHMCVCVYIYIYIHTQCTKVSGRRSLGISPRPSSTWAWRVSRARRATMHYQ